MKKLLLIRHAQATHQSGFIDFERPLTPEGLKDAAVMAGRIKAKEMVPQLLVSSPAVRTLSTANIFSQHCDLPAAEEILAIYDASQDQLADIVSMLDDDQDFIGLVGHNPAIGQLLYYLTGEARDVPPGAVALIEFEASTWAVLGSKSGKLAFYDAP